MPPPPAGHVGRSDAWVHEDSWRSFWRGVHSVQVVGEEEALGVVAGVDARDTELDGGGEGWRRFGMWVGG